jgi:hypothetical protein
MCLESFPAGDQLDQLVVVDVGQCCVVEKRGELGARRDRGQLAARAVQRRAERHLRRHERHIRRHVGRLEVQDARDRHNVFGRPSPVGTPSERGERHPDDRPKPIRVGTFTLVHVFDCRSTH